MIYAPGHEKESNQWEKAHLQKIFIYEFAQRSCLTVTISHAHESGEIIKQRSRNLHDWHFWKQEARL